MKRYYILVSFACICLSLSSNFYINLIYIALFQVFWFIKIRKQWYFVLVILVIYNFNFFNNKITLPDTYIMKVLEVRESYILATTGEDYIYVYNVQNVNIHDVIEIQGNYEKIHSFNNINMFDFTLYSHRNKIAYQIYASDFEIKAKSKSLQAKVYASIQTVDNKVLKEYYENIFYNKKVQGDGADYFFLGGFHLHFCISLILKCKKINRANLEVGISFLYALFFPVRFFIIYFFIKGCISLLCKHLNDKNQVGAITILLLFYNPMFIYHVGFIILLCFSYIRLFNTSKRMNNVIRYLVLVPIQLYNFHYVNIITIILFRPFQWIQGLLLCLSIISIVISPFTIFFSFLYEVWIVINKNIPDIFILIGKPPVWWVITWCIVIYQIISTSKRKPIIYVCALLIYQINVDKLNIFGEVMVLDVGQGDCILIHEPLFGKTILIDVAGSMKYDLASNVIYPVLRSKGIKKIDMVVITHDDYDHNGGLKELSELIKIDEILTTVEVLQLNDTTLYNLNSGGYKDKNDNSIVLFGSIYGVNYLFSADAGYIVEDEILSQYNKLHIDVLKVSHHGANTGTSDDFLQKTNPHIALISSGKNNAYGHPDKELMERLKKRETIIFNTQNNGSISFFYSRYFQFVRTADHQYGIIK